MNQYLTRRLYTVLVIALWLWGGISFAQASWTVEVLIPDVMSIRMPSTEIGFGLTLENYPPETYPAQYPATSPQNGILPVHVFTTAQGIWNLLIEIPDLEDRLGNKLLPADRIMYRINDGLWTRGNGNPQVVYTGNGPTGDWLELRLQFMLELRGGELAGAYEVDLRVSALAETGTP
jgi:hypothetical protein